MTQAPAKLKYPTDLGLRGLDLFVEVLANIEASPWLWNQDAWHRAKVDSPDLGLDLDVDGLTRAFRKGHLEDMVLEATGDDFEHVEVGDCGTAHCVAGWATHLCGFRPRWIANDVKDGRLELVATSVEDEQGHVYSTDSTATTLFGLMTTDDGQGRNLFAGANDLEEIYSIGHRLFEVEFSDLQDRVAARAEEIRAARPKGWKPPAWYHEDE